MSTARGGRPLKTSSRDHSRQPSIEPATEASVRATRQARSSSTDSGSTPTGAEAAATMR